MNLQNAMRESFTINPFMLLPLVILLIMAMKKITSSINTDLWHSSGFAFFAAVFPMGTLFITLASDPRLSDAAAIF